MKAWSEHHSALIIALLFVVATCPREDDNIDSYILVVGGEDSGGQLDTVEVISSNPTCNPVPDGMKVLGNFPAKIMHAVGTTFSKLKRVMQAAEL